MRSLTTLILAACLLTGCQAPMAAPVVPAPAAAVQPPKTLPEAQMRRLLSTSASLWGINYSQTFNRANGYREVRWQHPRSRTWYWIKQPISGQSYTGTASFSGKRALTRLDYNRYTYQVPEGQVLVLNQIEGVGTIYLNGFAIGVTRHDSGIERRINYVFGPGETVVINFVPERASESRTDTGTASYYTTSYQPLTLSGFTASPNLLGGASGFGAASSK